MPRYKVAPHPVGDIPTEEVFSIEDSQIVEVVFEGYENEADKDFLDDLLGRMSNAPAQAPVQQKEQTAPQTSPEEEEQEKLKKDPFYKFR